MFTAQTDNTGGGTTDTPGGNNVQGDGNFPQIPLPATPALAVTLPQAHFTPRHTWRRTITPDSSDSNAGTQQQGGGSFESPPPPPPPPIAEDQTPPQGGDPTTQGIGGDSSTQTPPAAADGTATDSSPPTPPTDGITPPGQDAPPAGGNPDTTVGETALIASLWPCDSLPLWLLRQLYWRKIDFQIDADLVSQT